MTPAPIKPGDWYRGGYVEKVEPFVADTSDAWRYVNVWLTIAWPDTKIRQRLSVRDPALPIETPKEIAHG